jgi:hypothetical protein
MQCHCKAGLLSIIPGSNRAGVADGLCHGGVAVGVAVADEVDAPEFPTAVGPSNLDLNCAFFGSGLFRQLTVLSKHKNLCL